MQKKQNTPLNLQRFTVVKAERDGSCARKDHSKACCCKNTERLRSRNLISCRIVTRLAMNAGMTWGIGCVGNLLKALTSDEEAPENMGWHTN